MRRLIALSGVLSLLLVTMTGLAGVALWQRSVAEYESRVAESRRLAAESTVALSPFPQRSVLLASEAVLANLRAGDSPQPEAEQALRVAVARVGGRTIGIHDAQVRQVVVSADGRWSVSRDARGACRAWDLGAPRPTSRPLDVPGLPGVATSLGMAPAGRKFVIGSGEGPVFVWDSGQGPGLTRAKKYSGLRSSAVTVAMDPGDRWLAAASREYLVDVSKEVVELRLWDTASEDAESGSRVLARIESKAYDPSDWSFDRIDFSPDGKWLVAWGESSLKTEARLWPVGGGGEPRPQVLKHPKGLLSQLAFDRQGRWLATASDSEAAVRVWRLGATTPASKMIILPGQNAVVTSIAFSPDGRYLAGGGGDGRVLLWDLESLLPSWQPRQLVGHGFPIVGMTFTGEGERLLTIGRDGLFLLWSGVKAAGPLTASRLASPAGRDLRAVQNLPSRYLATSSDARWLVAGEENQGAGLRVWDLGRISNHLAQAEKNARNANAAPFLPEDLGFLGVTRLNGHDLSLVDLTIAGATPLLATAGGEGIIRAYDLEGGGPASSPVTFRNTNYVSDRNIASADRFITVDSDGGVETRVLAKPWTVASRTKLAGLGDLAGLGADKIRIADDGRLVAAGFRDGTVKTWRLDEQNPASAREATVLVGHRYPVGQLTIAPDCRWIVAWGAVVVPSLWGLPGSTAPPGRVELRGHRTSVASCTFLGDGWLVTADRGGMIMVRDLTNAESISHPVTIAQGTRVTGLQSSKDGRWLVAYGDKTKLWDASLGWGRGEPMVLQGHLGIVRTADFSPDGRILATAGDDATVQIWEPGVGRRWILKAHELPIDSIRISPDGRWLASGSQDQVIRLWDLHAADPSQSARYIGTLDTTVNRISFSPDVRWLIATDLNGMTGFWHTGIKDLLEIAGMIAGRNLAQAESRQYFPGQAAPLTFPELPVPGEGFPYRPVASSVPGVLDAENIPLDATSGPQKDGGK
ncbi:WD40 repeat domain-containing protein [Paludisphaera borealis]|nr:WD40 repeat domain-containing protein [Paludisphaera borealis]